jgi:hypothetical protein
MLSAPCLWRRSFAVDCCWLTPFIKSFKRRSLEIGFYWSMPLKISPSSSEVLPVGYCWSTPLTILQARGLAFGWSPNFPKWWPCDQFVESSLSASVRSQFLPPRVLGPAEIDLIIDLYSPNFSLQPKILYTKYRLPVS